MSRKWFTLVFIAAAAVGCADADDDAEFDDGFETQQPAPTPAPPAPPADTMMRDTLMEDTLTDGTGTP